MVAAVKTQSGRTSGGIITVINQSFVDWCEANDKPLMLERIQMWQEQYRASRKSASPTYYSHYTAEELAKKAQRVREQLARIEEAAARK